MIALRWRAGVMPFAVLGPPAQVTVVNPNAGGATSNAVAFSVVNPAPTVATLAPAALPLGGQELSLKIIGTGFTSTTTVRFNDAPRQTTVESSTRLYARVTASDLAAEHEIAVVVSTPAPGGGNAAQSTDHREVIAAAR